jgi:hypothetical protein
MTILNTFIEKATLKKALLFTAVLGAFFILINFTSVGVAGLLQITNGANILDFEFGFSSSKAFDMLTALGEQGRTFYLTKIIPIDFLFPFSYMLCYATWIALLVKHTAPKSSIAKYFVAIPVLAMIFDWTENVGIIAMLYNYPVLPTWAVLTASVAGMLKTTLIIASTAMIAIMLILFIIKRIKQKN